MFPEEGGDNVNREKERDAGCVSYFVGDQIRGVFVEVKKLVIR